MKRAPEKDMSDALEAAGETTAEATVEAPVNLERALDNDRKVVMLAEKMATRQFDCARVVGQMQTLKAFADFSAAGRLKLFKEMKETRAYKNLCVPQSDGAARTIGTFEEFCEYMGTSANKVYEDLQNAAVFGEAFLESANKAGMGYRQLRALRALPKDAQEKLKAAADDPEELRIQVEEAVAENAKLKKRLTEATKTMNTRETMLADKNKALDAAVEEIKKLKSLSVDDAEQLAQGKAQAGLKKLIHDYGLLLGHGLKFFNTLNAALELEGLSPHMREEMEGTATRAAQELADMFANRLDWTIDFQKLVRPDWIDKGFTTVGEGSPDAPADAESAA
jgi:division protein CdvB (Snf7/Vps24/ESCRT-III family)